MRDDEIAREKLLPCPLCGKASSGQEFGPGPYLSRSAVSKFCSVICPGCCSTASGETESKVIEHWNTRAARQAAQPSVWDEAIAIVEDWHNLSGRSFNRKYGFFIDGLVNLVAALEAARDARQADEKQ